jgi:hypothetical protein
MVNLGEKLLGISSRTVGRDLVERKPREAVGKVFRHFHSQRRGDAESAEEENLTILSLILSFNQAYLVFYKFLLNSIFKFFSAFFATLRSLREKKRLSFSYRLRGRRGIKI